MDKNVMIRQKKFSRKSDQNSPNVYFYIIINILKKIFFYSKCDFLEMSFFPISSLLNNFVTYYDNLRINGEENQYKKGATIAKS